MRGDLVDHPDNPRQGATALSFESFETDLEIRWRRLHGEKDWFTAANWAVPSPEREDYLRT
jgi:hypothetical protein